MLYRGLTALITVVDNTGLCHATPAVTLVAVNFDKNSQVEILLNGQQGGDSFLLFVCYAADGSQRYPHGMFFKARDT